MEGQVLREEIDGSLERKVSRESGMMVCVIQ